MNLIKFVSYAILLLLIPSPSTMSAENRQNILCLHSYDPSYEWQKSMDTAINRTLLNAAPDIEIYHEYMDVLRIPDPAFQVDLFNYLKSKYRDIRFNVVLASDNNALNFLLNYRDWLMGPVPVVFLGINNYSRYMLRNQPFYTGVAENVDMSETLKTAMHLMPNIRKLIVYGSWNTTYFENISLLKEVVSENNLPVKIQQVENIPISQMLVHVSGLKNDDAVLFLSQILDDDGKVMPMTKSIQMISQASPVPVLSFWDFTLGNGVLGGKLVSGQSQGETAAHLALQILNGENINNLSVIEKSPNRFMFDYVQLKRFSIPLGALPENSLVINQPGSFFDRNKTAVLTILLILCALIAVIGVLSSTIIRRKRAEEALQRSEALYRLVVENINDIIWTFDLSSMTYTFVSSSVQRILGYADETMVKNLEVIFNPETKQHVLEAFGNFMEGYTEGDILVIDAEHRHKDGSLIWMEISATPLKDDSGSIVGFLGSTRNITEHKRAEEMLVASEIKYRRLFEAAKDGILILDAETGMIVDVNPYLVELLGYSSELFLGKTIWDIGFFKDIIKNKDKFLELQEKKYVRYDDLPLETAYGKVVDVEFISNVYDIDHKKVIQCNIRNITERKQAEQEKAKFETRLQQAQKMEAVGSLAGGIAHDLNNILFPISGLSEMMLDDISPDNPEYERIEQIHKSAQRGSDLVKQILAFSRQSNPQKLPIRIQPILKEVLKLARATIPWNIEIISHINMDCGMVSADPTQLHQIAMNLITNAYHAVEADGGTINIELKEAEFEKDLTMFNAMKSGKYACITVSDNGIGIDQTLINKIFDPYFTTKEMGKGTGLGLSVVHGIVKEHSGDIRVYSKIGKGTAFHVYLPLLEAVMDRKTAAIIRKYPTGCERILLVDDEEPIIRMEQKMLEKLGYQITVRTSSPDALAAFKANPGNFDLVISDRGMPNMTGEQLARELISIKPEIPIIICTGFSDEKDEQRAKAIGIKGFLMKPVATGDLATMVRKVLDEVSDSVRVHESGQADAMTPVE